MTRVALNLTVFLLAFFVGYLSTPVSPLQDQEISHGRKYEVTPDLPNEAEPFKYGCRDEETVSLWEKLDKGQFLRQQEALLLERDPTRGRKRFADFEETFGCSYFLGVDREDLNGDGIDELKAQGEGGMRDWPTYVFQQTELDLRMILAEAWTFEQPSDGRFNHGYRDIVYETNYTGSYREITRYKFDGRHYISTNCYSEDSFENRNGDMVPLDKPVVKRISCRDRGRVVQ